MLRGTIARLPGHRRSSLPPLSEGPTLATTARLSHACYRRDTIYHQLGPRTLERAVGARSGKFAAERSTHRSDSYGHVLSGRSGFVATNVSMAGIDIPLAGVNNSWGAGRIVNFIERNLSLQDADENGTWMCMPSS